MSDGASKKPLGAGATVRARGATQRDALLCGWVIDHLDRIYGLTARHAVVAVQGGVMEDVDAALVGREVEFEPLRGAAQPVEYCIARFRVADSALITADLEDWSAPPVPRDVGDMLGDRVYKVDRRGAHPALISELSGTMSLDHAGVPALLDGVAFLEPVEPETFGEADDAGALIVDTYGGPLGMLLAGGGERYAFAPLRAWLEMVGLRFISAEDAAIHNRRAGEPVRDEAHLSELVSEIADDIDRPPGELAEPRGYESALPRPEEKKSALAAYLELSAA